MPAVQSKSENSGTLHGSSKGFLYFGVVVVTAVVAAAALCFVYARRRRRLVSRNDKRSAAESLRSAKLAQAPRTLEPPAPAHIEHSLLSEPMPVKILPRLTLRGDYADPPPYEVELKSLGYL
ncbi:hypothetical protein PsYK624_050340 [Phanerochaete sordida]|uniref:Transmembrane protein n=1 Tax=Phanerochaete sordida TaxID=48140 RepID=A0A9P3LAZ3_9APHY|nr:hypothetical protein PsYK624_050340 [Phanerochaete sordida]